MPISSEPDLADVFFETAQKHVADRGYEFGNAQQFRQLAREGADKIFERARRNGVGAYDPRIMGQITEAEYHSKRFLDRMILSHRNRTGAQGGVLEDADFQFSSSWLSPMWPFCT
jgi:hypothetical protein